MLVLFNVPMSESYTSTYMNHIRSIYLYGQVSDTEKKNKEDHWRTMKEQKDEIESNERKKNSLWEQI